MDFIAYTFNVASELIFVFGMDARALIFLEDNREARW